MRELRRSTLPPALVVVVYAGWIGAALLIGHGARDFAFIGSKFVDSSHASPAIDRDRPYATSRGGYDGQFFLYIARDPRHASPYIDHPSSYRYSRIGYPIAARVLALGRQNLIPAMLIVVNLLAIGAGTLAVGLWLARRGTTPWLALVYGFYPGLFISLLRDLSEALAYGLAALAVVAFDATRPRRLAASAALFAAAILTRELTIAFVLAWAGTLFFRDRRRALVFGACAVAPYVAWKVFVRAWLGSASVGGQAHATIVPFGGLFAHPWDGSTLFQVLCVVVPTTFAAALAAWALRRRAAEAALWAVVVNWVLFVALLPKEAYAEYIALTRVSMGVFLAFLLSVPALKALIAPQKGWVLAPAVAWFLPWIGLLPQAFSRSWT